MAFILRLFFIFMQIYTCTINLYKNIEQKTKKCYHSNVKNAPLGPVFWGELPIQEPSKKRGGGKNGTNN